MRLLCHQFSLRRGCRSRLQIPHIGFRSVPLELTRCTRNRDFRHALITKRQRGGRGAGLSIPQQTYSTKHYKPRYILRAGERNCSKKIRTLEIYLLLFERGENYTIYEDHLPSSSSTVTKHIRSLRLLLSTYYNTSAKFRVRTCGFGIHVTGHLLTRSPLVLPLPSVV